MSGLDNLNTRLRYYGGNQQGRMNADKLKGLRKALLYSYQAVTLIMPLREGEDEPRKFRALINPDKTKNDYDQKIVSIPFLMSSENFISGLHFDKYVLSAPRQK